MIASKKFSNYLESNTAPYAFRRAISGDLDMSFSIIWVTVTMHIATLDPLPHLLIQLPDVFFNEFQLVLSVNFDLWKAERVQYDYVWL